MLEQTIKIIRETYDISDKVIELVERAEKEISSQFHYIDEIREFNQYKILKVFQAEKIESRHFSPTTGYGYDDVGRDALDRVYAGVFNCEDALVRPQIVSGTHALALCLYALLRPGDRLLSLSGKPYDTLEEVIGISGGKGRGSLEDFGINYSQVELKEDGTLNTKQWESAITPDVKVVMLQRSRGYDWRPSLSIEDLEKGIKKIREIRKDVIIMIDNCYGEFTEILEPTDVGADLIAGSLIKNPGGGLAPTGAYIAGRASLIEQVAYRLTSPGIGKEVGSYAGWYTPFFQGLFLAPHIVAESMKGAVLAARVFELLGFNVTPGSSDKRSDIIQSIKFDHSSRLIAFCQGIQKAAPVDSHVIPEPWDMPGYQHKVIMAAGAFIQGSSIELSADAPIKHPYIAYLQGGLTYSHCKMGIMISVKEMLNRNLITLPL